LNTPITLGTIQVTQAVAGTPQRDSIIGTTQGEAIAGGPDKDRLTGGGGPDAFVFETPGEFGKSRADIITDFKPRDGDKVVIASDSFVGLSRIRFTVVTGAKEARLASATNKNFIYDDKKGRLYYDANGKKNGWGNGGEFAQLLGAPTIGAGDLVVV
jgi:Ca2+-binding RTX toxin-like protein